MNKPMSYDKQMEQGWLGFRRETIPEHADPAQLRESSRCFYAGGYWALEVLFGGEYNKEEHVAILNGLQKELIRVLNSEGLDIPDSGHGPTQ